jgi:PAS domain S-box-containing protein
MLETVSKASRFFIVAVAVTLLSQLFIAVYLLNIFSSAEENKKLSVRAIENITTYSTFISKLQLTIGHMGYIHNENNEQFTTPELINKVNNDISDLMALKQKIILLKNSNEEIIAINDIYQTIDLYKKELDVISTQGDKYAESILHRLQAVDDQKAHAAIELLSNKLIVRELKALDSSHRYLQNSSKELEYGLFVVGLLFLQTLVLLYSFYKLNSQNKKLDNSQRHLNSFIDESPEAMLVINTNGQIIKANQAVAKLLGYQSHELQLLPLERLLPKEFHSGFETFLQSLEFKGKKIKERRRRNMQFTKKDGSDIDVEYSVAVLQNSPYVILNIKDVTIQKIAEKTAIRAQRMEAVGQLTAGVAHDFNNILATIMGNTECAELFIADKAQSEHHLNLVKQAVERASSLTSQLLAFSRKQPLQQTLLIISDVVAEMTDILKSILGRTINLNIDSKDTSWAVEIDKVQLETALINLCLNAKEAMSEGGSLSIIVENVTLDDAYVKQIEGTDNDYVKISVYDTGHGIPDAIKNKVVEPFFTTKTKGQASGLGLSMVFGFIKQSKGSLQISSEEGKGTLVILFIPRSQNLQMTESLKPIATPDERIEKQSTIILVIEDDDEVRKLPILLLNQEGYRVLEAANPEEAIRIAEDVPRIDLIFSDVILSSEINGIELSALLLKRHNKAKLILTTGYMNEISLRDNDIPEDTPILKKPYNRKQLLQLVASTLGIEDNSPKH